MKIGRNESCPCGSGKKYKKCCLDKSDEQRLAEAVLRSSENLKKKHILSNVYIQTKMSAMKKL
nr:SEC-C metal-binding domain-containing protein [uncultured Eubacterium sp.]